MNDLTASVGAQVRKLFGLFSPADDFPEYEIVSGDEVPAPYHDLLVHEEHMTVTVEAFHGDAVDVRVLARSSQDEWYARKILLALKNSGRVVQFGIMRTNLHHCSPEVCAEILSEKVPLGRILIRHDVLRRIQPTAFLRVIPNAAMIDWFALDRPRTTYGRLAYIHGDQEPIVEVLEIVVPERRRR